MFGESKLNNFIRNFNEDDLPLQTPQVNLSGEMFYVRFGEETKIDSLKTDKTSVHFINLYPFLMCTSTFL
jgi:hypothetical protein